MIICPVCEHPQAQGDECDQCGKRLVRPRPAPAAVAPMPELELTPHAGGKAPVAVERVADLEPTRTAPAGNVVHAPMLELETGRSPRCHTRGRVGRPCTDCGTVVRASE